MMSQALETNLPRANQAEFELTELFVMYRIQPHGLVEILVGTDWLT